jgi:hypothetical protein
MNGPTWCSAASCAFTRFVAARTPLAIVQCHPLQGGRFEDLHVSAVFTGNRQQGRGQTVARSFDFGLVIAEVAGNL